MAKSTPVTPYCFASVTVAPQHWQKVQELGLPGVIDLVNMTAEELEALARPIGWSDVALLRSLANRLRQDAQAQIIWLLYQFDSEAEPTPNDLYEGDDDSASEARGDDSAGQAKRLISDSGIPTGKVHRTTRQ